MRIRFLIIALCTFVSLTSFVPDKEQNPGQSVENFRIDEVGLDSGGVFTFWGLYFNLGSYELFDTSSFKHVPNIKNEFLRSNEVRLMTIADYMLRHPGYIIEICVHTDCRGSKHSSRRLSQRRAQTICEELAALGVQEERLIPKGFEDSEPYLDNGQLLTCDYIMQFSKKDQEPLHQKNRRYEIRLLSKDYVMPESNN